MGARESRAVRVALTVTVDPATESRLIALAEASRSPRGRVLDAVLTHAPSCGCAVCSVVRRDRECAS